MCWVALQDSEGSLAKKSSPCKAWMPGPGLARAIAAKTTLRRLARSMTVPRAAGTAPVRPTGSANLLDGNGAKCSLWDVRPPRRRAIPSKFSSSRLLKSEALAGLPNASCARWLGKNRQKRKRRKVRPTQKLSPLVYDLNCGMRLYLVKPSGSPHGADVIHVSPPLEFSVPK